VAVWGCKYICEPLSGSTRKELQDEVRAVIKWFSLFFSLFERLLKILFERWKRGEEIALLPSLPSGK